MLQHQAEHIIPTWGIRNAPKVHFMKLSVNITDRIWNVVAD